MYLKSIKAIGFKSFCDPINIELTDKITGIVGPNGSGKSNVVDAVRWVLGEQSVKSLRGEGSMIDVIFTGSKSRKASNYASVSLIFDNKDRYLSLDVDEVIIKRTIYKSGENEYSINKQKCRLKDILELFTDTGASKESFNIISQGDIGNILSSKAEDRRIIFEDAANVLKYKKRKEEALKKLTITKDNIQRVEDIISEITNQLNPLKDQSIKAQKYIENKKELENIEVALIIKDIDDYNYEYKKSKENIELLTDKISKILSSSSKEQALIEELKNKINTLNNNLYNNQKELATVSANVERLSGEKNLIKERSKYNSDNILLHDNILNLKEQLLNIQNEEENIKVKLDLLNKENSELSVSLEKYNKNINALTIDKEKIIIDLNKTIKKISELKNKKEVLENSIENNSKLPYGVRNVLNNIKLTGINGVVGKLFETEEKYTLSLDTALGLASTYIVTDTFKEAKEAVDYLNNNNLGRATFYPLNVIKSRYIDKEILDKAKRHTDFIYVCNDLINYDPKYKNIFENLLGNVLVVKDLNIANEIAKVINNKYKIVTLDGNIVNIGGSITGGSIKNKDSILKEKYELEDVIKEINTTQNNLSIIENKINEIDHEYANNEQLKKDILIKIDINSASLNEINNKLKELDLTKESINNELRSNNNTIKNILSNEEDEIIKKYYDEKNKQDRVKIEIENLFKNIEKEKEKLTDLETNLKVDNKEYNNVQDELKKNEIKVSKLDIKLDNLLNILTEDYSISYEKAKANYILEEDVEVARKKVSKLKLEIKNLGDVNVSSIDEYKRIKERYDFLSSQKEDLLKASNMLLDIINQMDEIMKEKFLETFNQVQKEFSETFKELFNGGDARLELTNSKDLLSTGIDIIALPPGKKLQHISLLSGGEKTLTAIALLFSILKTRPVPFAILDEVEAALDEVNVDNFGKYLHKFKNNTQFIVITHKKKTMEYADVLYGITMQESGVSKLVSVKLEEIKQ